jgi:small subunit ribosomal protein S1
MVMEEIDSPTPEIPAENATAQNPPGPGEAPETETTEAFAELLASSAAGPAPHWKRGEKVQARVVRVTDEWVFVTLGTKEEGTIRRGEFVPEEQDAEGAEVVRVPVEGEMVDAYVLSTQGGEVVLTTKLARKDASKAAIEEAWQSAIPVAGKVVQAVKGGFEVRISGLRAFCPLSLIDIRWPKEPEIHLGQTYTFRVLEFKEKGRNIILSRRALLEEERAKQREALKERIVPGAVVSGTVRSVQSFGAFVELGGVEALIPVSEMSWKRVEGPSEVVALGQEVTAKVLSVDWERDRVSLSLKALEEDPWLAAVQRVQPGQHPGLAVLRVRAPRGDPGPRRPGRPDRDVPAASLADDRSAPRGARRDRALGDRPGGHRQPRRDRAAARVRRAGLLRRGAPDGRPNQAPGRLASLEPVADSA